MQIVIDMPEEIYERFGYEYREENLISEHMKNIILDAFCNGKPLPKGRGDLIDRRKLVKELSVVLCRSVQSQMWIIEQAPTIIEAERNEEENVSLHT